MADTANSKHSRILDKKKEESTRRISEKDTESDQIKKPVIGKWNETKFNQNISKDLREIFLLSIDLDVMQLLLFLLAIGSRMLRLNYPKSVVFDEIQFGRLISHYANGSFFMDIHPPLSKMMHVAVALIAGYDGSFEMKNICDDYSDAVPYLAMRMVSAFFGSCLIPLVYQILVELHLSRWTAMLAAFMLLIENSLITQSRIIMPEMTLLFFIIFSTLSYIKFRGENLNQPFSTKWWTWLAITGVSMTIACLIKYSAILTCILILVLIFHDLWQFIPDHNISEKTLYNHLIARIFCLVIVPLVLYLSVFQLHFMLLAKSGPHDDMMSSQFQATLQNGLQQITKGQPRQLAYGSQITLRNTNAPSACWLHSHNNVYPVKYADDRGSSHQQQVTCYNFKDVNNWWIIKHPNRSELYVDDPIVPIKDGDIIELVHGITNKLLNSHDVAAPMTPGSQEVSCYINYNVSMFPQTSWRVEIANKALDSEESNSWKTITSQVRLIHVNTSQAMKTTGKRLPQEWGHSQLEVVTDRLIVQDRTVWNAEEHKYIREPGALVDSREQEIESIQQLGCWQKFIELQVKMWTSQKDANLDHKYKSSPFEWPFFMRNIAYWVHRDNRAQIHLVGNQVLWCSATAAVVVLTGLLIFYNLRMRRLCYDLDFDCWCQFSAVCQVLLGGYLINYIPYFTFNRTMFIYQYLPAFVFKVCVLAYLVEHIYHLIPNTILRNILLVFVGVWMLALLYVSMILLPVTYGMVDLTAKQLKSLDLTGSWDFLKMTH